MQRLEPRLWTWLRRWHWERRFKRRLKQALDRQEKAARDAYYRALGEAMDLKRFM